MHGTPFGGTHKDRASFIRGRHVLIPFPNPEDLPIAGECAASFCLDNGAFSAWKSGKPVADWSPYIEFCQTWMRHPAFDFCIIPDVIDGSETANNELMDWFVINSDRRLRKAPVWHLHESTDRLRMLVDRFDIVCLGSSGDYKSPGGKRWWIRIGEAMKAACDEHGRPIAKLHGLRMLNPKIFTRIPLSSADSTNCARNSTCNERFGMYPSPHRFQRAVNIADRIEIHQSPPIWKPSQKELTFLSDE